MAQLDSDWTTYLGRALMLSVKQGYAATAESVFVHRDKAGFMKTCSP